tara:strand:- start:9 stop:197 length:189 start_codon:yes stop_codon:yes gene_type:complete
MTVAHPVQVVVEAGVPVVPAKGLREAQIPEAVEVEVNGLVRLIRVVPVEQAALEWSFSRSQP